MPEYTVKWVIELTADSRLDAARQALEIQRDPTSLATHFTVIDEDGIMVEIDDAEYEDYCADCGVELPPDHDHCLNGPCDNCLCPACYQEHNGICLSCYENIEEKN